MIWDVYIVNPTVDAALEGLEGEPGVGMFINEDRKENLSIRPFADGFSIYGVSKGYWGWSVTDEMFIKHNGGDPSIKVMEKTFHYHQKKSVNIMLITTKDRRIDKIVAYPKNAESFAFNRTINGNTQLYYQYSELPLEEVTYKAISKDGEVLYFE